MNKRRTAVGGHTHQTKNKKPQAAQWKLTRPAQLEKKWLVHDQKNKLQMEEPLTGLLSCFFPSVTADLALRLGPDSERSVKKCAKNWNSLASETHHGTKTTRTNKKRQQRRPANLPVCASSRSIYWRARSGKSRVDGTIRRKIPLGWPRYACTDPTIVRVPFGAWHLVRQSGLSDRLASPKGDSMPAGTRSVQRNPNWKRVNGSLWITHPAFLLPGLWPRMEVSLSAELAQANSSSLKSVVGSRSLSKL